MDNTINGRTPEEIKQWLNCESIQNTHECEEHYTCTSCPHFIVDDDGIPEATIAYIRQLERERDAAVEAQPKWISVEERLPEESFEVLMLFKHNMAAGWYGGEGDWYSNTDDGFYASCDGEPTRWMPLPEPPKEDK